jgi:hypothetical protein
LGLLHRKITLENFLLITLLLLAAVAAHLAILALAVEQVQAVI